MCSKHIEVSKKCSFRSLFIKVKMGVRLCYKGDEPKSVVKVAEVYILITFYFIDTPLATMDIVIQ